MMNKPLVTIIVPVYNCEQFLDQSILSVVNQTYVNLEIVIINDGSTDRSLDIIHKYAHLDQRISVIDKPNEGLVLTRKKGLEIATGKYIQFLDSDDTLMIDAIELLVTKAESANADIVALPFFFCDSNKLNKASAPLQFTELNGLDYLKEILNGRAYWSVWSNFQKRSFVETVPLELFPEFYFGEDAVWMTQLLLHNPKVVSLEKAVLSYNWNPFSLSNCGSMLNVRYKSFRDFQVWMEYYLEKKGVLQFLEKELALQHLQTTFTSIQWKQLQHVTEDMKRIFSNTKKFPELKQYLSRRQYKMIILYHISTFAGRLYLNSCIKKDKYLG
ncbi:glycosyltransferase [Bacteroides sp.]|uniref:glycosyltransferase family 2 protein n=1 Tax=Bacteroides sp. TaxID=29523 RepID=UPI001B539AD9|nr:glycosyltransferase [Bacteroides sp.]MBP6064546.1 glycosyltransferase [Bacteroides sp.]MBP6066707.1 glycosyltransferase [Bacteroides sp.]MBP6935457.1 glycosyltransferase [Bacteroides sp.]MBP9585349.1 glycosyltransferase [Bacteroides sp.]